MNILYIAHLSTNIAAGPNWSVPARVQAQSKYDNVLLINTTNVMMAHWRELSAFHNLEEFGELHLFKFPRPFCNPDVVVFEGFNFIEHAKFARELKKAHIPYIITPRGALTYEAQHNHAWLKKMLARWMFFESYVRNARAIQYLTEGELESSSRMFQTSCFVLPNGFNEPLTKKTAFSKEGIKAVFIGRLDMHHKGIDLLLNAISSIKTELYAAGFKLNIYGPKRYDYYKIEETIKIKALESIVELHDVISGKEKEKILLATDLFVMTSRLEGLPMGLLEALSYGVPSFVTKGTNMKTEIERFNAGWTCNGTESEIKNGLLTVVSEKSQLSQKGKNAIELSSHYQWDILARRFHKKAEELINTSGVDVDLACELE